MAFLINISVNEKVAALINEGFGQVKHELLSALYGNCQCVQACQNQRLVVKVILCIALQTQSHLTIIESDLIRVELHLSDGCSDHVGKHLGRINHLRGRQLGIIHETVHRNII